MRTLTVMERPTRDRWNALSLGILLAAGCAALLLVLLAGCGEDAVAGPPAGRSQPTATHTPATNATRWQIAPGWPGMGALAFSTGNLPQISPTDGNTVYACAGSTPQNNLRVWVTHDLSAPNGGAQWTRLADLPIVENQTNGCTIVVDTTAPATLVAMTPLGGQEFGEVSFASFDGGQSWHQLGQQPRLFSGSITTYQGKI